MLYQNQQFFISFLNLRFRSNTMLRKENLLTFGIYFPWLLCLCLCEVLTLDNIKSIDGMYTVLSNISLAPAFQYQNTQVNLITKMIVDNKCKCLEKSLRFAIVDNKVFSFGRKAAEKTISHVEIFLHKHSETLPNMYLLVLPKLYLTSSDLNILLGPQCKPIPFFIDEEIDMGIEQFNSGLHSLLRRYSRKQNLILTRKEKIKIQKGQDIHDILLQKLQLQKFIDLDDQDFSKWYKTLDLITIQETIEEFPFLRKNIDPMTLSEMFSKTNCNNRLINILIMENKVYLGQIIYDGQRARTVKHFLEQILNDTNLPDMYILVHTNDIMHLNLIPPQQHELCRNMPIFMMNKNSSDFLEQTKFLMPDPYVIQQYWSINVNKIKIMNFKNKWQNKKKIAFFRGLASGPHYYDLGITQKIDFFKYFHRAAFVQLSNQYPDLIDARFTPEYYAGVGSLINETKRRLQLDDIDVLGKKIDQNELPKYRYLLTADGFGAPWRRTPCILFSNSILLKPYSQKIQWFYDKILPNVHYIPIKQDLSDLITRVQKMNIDDINVTEIPKRANKVAEQHLTNQALKLYMAEVLTKYAEIQQLKLSEKAKKMIRSYRKLNRVFLKLRSTAFQNNNIWDQGFFRMVVKQIIFLFFNFLLICSFPMISLMRKKKINQNKSIYIFQEQQEGY